MKHLDEMPNKQQHCYLVSYQAGKHTGHTHIYCDTPLTPPRDTVDIIKTTADDIGCNQGDVIITSIFYFGFIFPQAVIEDEQGQEEPEIDNENYNGECCYLGISESGMIDTISGDYLGGVAVTNVSSAVYVVKVTSMSDSGFTGNITTDQPEDEVRISHIFQGVKIEFIDGKPRKFLLMVHQGDVNSN